MDNKFKKATKRITAVAASAVIVSSTAFGAGLGNYPTNFVSDGKFNGQVVVGSGADAMDSTSAQSIIDDLSSELSGEADKVKITYKDSANGEEARIMKSNNEINFGEDMKDSFLASDLDDSDLDLFAEREYNDVDYNQKFSVANVGGKLDKKLGDSLHDSQETDDQVEGIFFNDGAQLGTYTLTFDSAVAKDVSDKLMIMGTEYIVSNLAANEVTLLGGSNSISLGETESSTVTIDGKSYEVEVLAVSSLSNTDKVLVSVNGESKTIEEGKSETVAGVEVIASELVPSNRDSVKGYAELIVGGHEIKLKDGDEVEVDGEDVSDIDDRFTATASVDSTANDITSLGFTLKTDEDLVLTPGESFVDPLFGKLVWSFDELNKESAYDVEVSSSARSASVSAVLRDGTEFSLDDVVEFDSSEDELTMPGFNGADDDVQLVLGDDDNTLVLSDETKEGSRFIVEANEETTLYELVDFDEGDDDDIGTADDRVTLKDVIADKEFTVDVDELADKLQITGGVVINDGADTVTLDVQTGNGFVDYLLLDEGFVMTFIETSVGQNANDELRITIAPQEKEVNADEEPNTFEADETVTVAFTWDAGDDDVVVTVTDGAAFVGGEVEKSSDEGAYVSRFGTTYTWDADDKDEVVIGVPESQTYAEVSLTFGEAGSTSTVTVDASEADAKVAELEADGYTIVGEPETVEGESAEFDITAPAYDDEVSSMENMIVVGGPAINSVAASLLGLEFPTFGVESGVAVDEAVVRYFEDSNTVLVYGFEGKDTAAAAEKLNAGGLSGSSVNVAN